MGAVTEVRGPNGDAPSGFRGFDRVRRGCPSRQADASGGCAKTCPEGEKRVEFGRILREEMALPRGGNHCRLHLLNLLGLKGFSSCLGYFLGVIRG